MKPQDEKKKVMVCCECGAIDDSYSAYCAKHGRSSHILVDALPAYKKENKDLWDSLRECEKELKEAREQGLKGQEGRGNQRGFSQAIKEVFDEMEKGIKEEMKIAKLCDKDKCCIGGWHKGQVDAYKCLLEKTIPNLKKKFGVDVK